MQELKMQDTKIGGMEQLLSCSDSSQDLALYKSFTYLLTY